MSAPADVVVIPPVVAVRDRVEARMAAPAEIERRARRVSPPLPVPSMAALT
ncbi:MAG: hypothetical protein ACKODL_10330 [Phenylobacterium sp.]